MKRKIFISINIPEHAKKRLIDATAKWQDLPVKWTKVQNLHLTLVFLGYVETEDLESICRKVSSAAGQHQIFDIPMDCVRLFPDENDPKMICLLGNPSEELKNLVADIENELGISKGPKSIFRPHITLGRIRQHKWMMLDDKPEIYEDLNISIPVETVDIMASDFNSHSNGQNYVILESCPLSG